MTLEELLGDEKEFQFLIGKVEPNQKLLVYIPRMGLPSQFLIGKVEQPTVSSQVNLANYFAHYVSIPYR